MSLLGSIFGNAKEEDSSSKKSKKKGSKKEQGSDGLAGLFAQSSDLPERPQHVPKPRPTKRKAAVEEPKEEESPKKRRKPRKEKKSEDTETGETTEIEKEEEGGSGGGDEDDNNEDDVESRTIFVGNLPIKATTRKSLAALFKDCGKVVSTRIRAVPVQGIKLPPQRAGDQKLMKKVCVNRNLVDYENSAKETVQGYVVFENEESVAKALELNNVLAVDGRRIRVDRASPSVEPSRSVFIGNLPYAADEMTLQEHFVKGCDLDVGDVEGVRIIRDKETYQCKGFGYVLLKEKSMVPTALKLHESMYMNKSIRVLVCGKRFKNKKGQNTPTTKQHGQTKPTGPIKGSVAAPKEEVSVGVFRRILAKQQHETAKINKRKRGEKKKSPVAKKGRGTVGLSRRAALDKKVEKKVKKLQKRMAKGMGKNRA